MKECVNMRRGFNHVNSKIRQCWIKAAVWTQTGLQTVIYVSHLVQIFDQDDDSCRRSAEDDSERLTFQESPCVLIKQLSLSFFCRCSSSLQPPCFHCCCCSSSRPALLKVSSPDSNQTSFRKLQI